MGAHNITSWQWARLGDLFTVIAGGNFPRETSDKGLPILRGRDLTHESLKADDLERFLRPAKVHDNKFIKAGDIIIQRIGDTPKAVVADTTLEGVYAGDTVFVLRPNTPDADVYGVAQYLSSPQARCEMRSRSRHMTVFTLSTMVLRELPVPQIPLAHRKALSAAVDAQKSVRQFGERFQGLRNEYFDASSDEDVSGRVVQLNIARLVAESSLQITSELVYQVRNFFPLPIAFPFRIADDYDPVRGLKESYRTAEGLVTYLASVGLALIPDDDRKVLIPALLRGWGGKGATFGNWIGIMKEVAAMSVKGAGGFAEQLRRLTSGPFMEMVKAIQDDRDKFHHESLPPEGDQAEKRRKLVTESLHKTMEQAAFLIQFPIRYVLDLDASRDGHSFSATCLDLSGDHPSCRRFTTQLVKAVTKRDLYVVVDDEWHSLHPFMSMHSVGLAIKETFFVDAWEKDTQEARLKSFERGTNHTSPEVSTDLGGILKQARPKR